MSKYFLSSISILTFLGTITGCAFHGPSSHEELCNQLRSQYTFNSIDNNMTAVTTTRTQKQAVADQLKANNC